METVLDSLLSSVRSNVRVRVPLIHLKSKKEYGVLIMTKKDSHYSFSLLTLICSYNVEVLEDDISELALEVIATGDIIMARTDLDGDVYWSLERDGRRTTLLTE